MSDRRVQTIKNFKRPVNVHETSYFRKFIRNFAGIAEKVCVKQKDTFGHREY